MTALRVSLCFLQTRITQPWLPHSRADIAGYVPLHSSGSTRSSNVAGCSPWCKKRCMKRYSSGSHSPDSVLTSNENASVAEDFMVDTEEVDESEMTGEVDVLVEQGKKLPSSPVGPVFCTMSETAIPRERSVPVFPPRSRSSTSYCLGIRQSTFRNTS